MNDRLQPAPTSMPTLALRPREAAKALGISPRTLWQLTKDGKVPCVRAGTGKHSAKLYPISVLQTWLDNATKTQIQGHDDTELNHG